MSIDGPNDALRSGSPYGRLLAAASDQRQLISVHWEMTYRCVQRCGHCYLEALPAGCEPEGELSGDESFSAVDQIADLGALRLSLSGGEVLLRPDFFEIAGHARFRQLALRIFSSGLPIGPVIAERIAALHPLSVEISVYGADAETHEEVTRHPGSFARVRRAFELLRANGVRTVFKTPLMRHNIGQWQRFQDLAAELGAQFRADLTITPALDGSDRPLHYGMSDEQLLRWTRAHLRSEDWPMARPPADSRTCNIGRSNLVLDPYGNVHPCVELRNAVGNIRARPLREIWSEAPRWDEWLRLKWESLPVCRACSLQPLCCRCHGLALNETGSLLGPAWLSCRTALARRQVLVERNELPQDYPVPEHLSGREMTVALARME